MTVPIFYKGYQEVAQDTLKIPDKLYFKIGEVSDIAGVEPHVLRYWESELRIIRPQRANSKQRLYRRVDVENILKIKKLLHEDGFTIPGARKYLAAGKETKAADEKAEAAKPFQPPPARAAIDSGAGDKAILKNIRSELEDLKKMLAE